MKYRKTAPTLATAVAFAIASAGVAGTAAADELSELKAAVAALQARLEKLESQTQEAVDTNDKQTDLIAKVRTGVPEWVGRTGWTGDFRYRNENIEQEFATKDRNRDRVRARLGVVAKANDTLRAGVQIATSESNDPRSSNQTITGENSRKTVNLDLAYAEWQPNITWKVTAGKMKLPWLRPGQSVLIDGDVNPEGLAVNYTPNANFFATAAYNILEERAAAGESIMAGGQVGYRWNFSPATRLTLGAGYFDFTGVQGKNPFYNASSNGNTTTTLGTVCRPGASPCLLSDFTELEGFGELTTMVGKLPLSFHADYWQNTDAETDFDTAYSVGVMLGRVSNSRTWEIGYVFQHVEKDAVYGQYIDSDFGGGNTDAEGSIFKVGYAFARNWALNLTYFMNDINIDVPVTIAGQGAVLDRSYKRLQVDLNVKY
ncbi:MAG: putative porin [Steroidobacteraceae bacterium]